MVAGSRLALGIRCKSIEPNAGDPTIPEERALAFSPVGQPEAARHASENGDLPCNKLPLSSKLQDTTGDDNLYPKNVHVCLSCGGTPLRVNAKEDGSSP